MARLDFDGFEALDGQFARLLDRGTIRRIVEAGARKDADEMRANITAASHVRTGSMLENVRPGDYKEDLNGAEMVVYPRGNDKNGVRQATKAYVINYGRGGRRTRRMGDKFITGKLAQTETAVQAAMQAESDRILAEINK